MSPREIKLNAGRTKRFILPSTSNKRCSLYLVGGLPHNIMEPHSLGVRTISHPCVLEKRGREKKRKEKKRKSNKAASIWPHGHI
jgi:hypothetical protein